MNKRIKKLIRKYDKVYSNAPWYGYSITKILRNVDSKIVFNKTGGKSHSIAELAAHMLGWREIAFNRMRENNKPAISQKETFNWRRFDKNEKTAWKNLLKELDNNQKKLISFLEKKDDGFLNRKVPAKRSDMEFLIEGIIQHDIYHLGQIAVLKKLLS